MHLYESQIKTHYEFGGVNKIIYVCMLFKLNKKMKKLLILISAILVLASCEKDEELYSIKTQGDFTGQAYTLGTATNYTPAGVEYYAWLTTTPYKGANCYVIVFDNYPDYQEGKQTAWNDNSKAQFFIKNKRMAPVTTIVENTGIDYSSILMTWYESITKEEYDRLYKHYNEVRYQEFNEGGQHIKDFVFDKAEKVNVTR